MRHTFLFIFLKPLILPLFPFVLLTSTISTLLPFYDLLEIFSSTLNDISTSSTLTDTITSSSPTISHSPYVIPNTTSTSPQPSSPLSPIVRKSSRVPKIPSRLHDFQFSLPQHKAANFTQHRCNFVHLHSLPL